MRKILFAVAGFAALAGAAGLAIAQQAEPEERRFDLFHADADNDGVLTRQEFDASHDARFASLDANSDGQLTRDEMWARRGEHRFGRHGMRGMHHIARADADNDGNITREEFLARPNQMFDRIDANSDGVIGADERPQRRERGERGERHGRFQLDSNDDGQISRAEFAAMGAAMFDRLDANDDGRVTREEADAARPHRRGRE